MVDFIKWQIYIAYPEKAVKKDLWNDSEKSRRPPEYVIDKMAERKKWLH